MNGQIEVLSADDGHVVRTLADGTDPSVDKQGNVYFTRTKALPPVSTPCNTDLNQYVARVASTGGDPVSVVDNAAGALVSPDGHWLAYGSWQCNGDKLHLFLGLTDLRTGRNYRPFEQQFTAHPAKIGLLAWSPDSSELVFAANGETWDQRGLMALRDLPLAGGADPAQVPGGADVGGATFLPNGHLLAARATDPGRAYDVVELDGSGNVIGTRFSGAGFVPSLALDPSGQRLLVTFPNGSLSVQEGTEQPRAVAPKVQGAAWLPAAPVGVGDVVAEQDNSIVMLSAVDGHVTRTIAADAAPGTGVAVTPDGSTVVYRAAEREAEQPGLYEGPRDGARQSAGDRGNPHSGGPGVPGSGDQSRRPVGRVHDQHLRRRPRARDHEPLDRRELPAARERECRPGEHRTGRVDPGLGARAVRGQSEPG